MDDRRRVVLMVEGAERCAYGRPGWDARQPRLARRKGSLFEVSDYSPHLFLKGDPDRVRAPETGDTPDHGQRRSRIRCPRCGWEPGRHDLWMCTCLHCWNTFDTRGVCPACGRKWAETQCRRCNEWSAHDDWYSDELGP